MFRIKEIKNKETWNNFLFKIKEKTFLSSWEWGEFQEKMGNKIFRIGIFGNRGKLIAEALITKIISKRGTFLLIQHGPLISQKKKNNLELKINILNILLNELKKISKEEKASFVRIAPLLERNEENMNIFKDLGFKNSPMHASAYEATWKLDINYPEEDLLRNMRKTTRYLIRKTSANKDIVILKSNDIKDIKNYQNLNKEVAKKQNFVPFSSKFIENEFKVFSENDQSLLIFGKYKNEIIAGALIIFWQNIGFYHQAASLGKYSKLSIPYLIQWEAIKEAKKRGCVLYDFWGYVDPFKNTKHPWAGPTLFKMGFGGHKKEYIKTQDFPFSLSYLLTYFFEKIRKIKRRL